MLVSLLFSSVPLCLIASNNLVQLSLIRMAMSLADSGLHISVELCQSHRAFRKSSSYLMVGANINHNLVANFGTRSDILNQAANIDVDVVFSSVGKNQMQVCTSLAPCTRLSLCLNRTRLHNHILRDIDVHIQIGCGLLDVITLCDAFGCRGGNSNRIVGLRRNSTDLLIHITHNGGSSHTGRQRTDQLFQCVHIGLGVCTGFLGRSDSGVFTIGVCLCIVQCGSGSTGGIESTLILISSCAQTMHLHISTIELNGTIGATLNQCINSLIGDGDSAYQRPC